MEHDECPASACKIPMGVGTADADWGACFGTTNVLDVPGSGVANAINAMGAELVLRVTDGTQETEVATVPDDASLAIIVVSGAPTWTQTLAAGPQLTVGDGASVWMDAMALSGNSDTDDFAIESFGGDLYARRCSIVDNNGGGIEIDGGGRLALDNAFVGVSVSELDAVSIVDGDARIRYSTIVSGSEAMSRALACGAGADVAVTDSILATRTDGVPNACEGATTERTAERVPLETTWFANFVAGDFHLTDAGATEFANIAQWNDGDPRVDIDGDARSGVDGTDEVAGADLP